MEKERKIFFEKNDSLKEIEKDLRNAKEEKIIINIPRNSPMGRGIENFHRLIEVAEEEEKEILIESIDEHILELAGLAGIKAVNPVFRVRERAVSDIIPKPKKTKSASMRVEERQKEVIPQNTPEKEEREVGVPKYIPSKPKKERRIRQEGRRWVIYLSGAVILILGAGILLWSGLPKAKITLAVKKVSVPLEIQIEVKSSITTSEVGKDSIILPGELLVSKQNTQMMFDANTKRSVEEKATGILTVYNAYSSKSQSIVATTRFEAPNGKIFRLNEKTIIPAAKVENGKITPSSIKVKVTAEDPGEEYNLEAGLLWTIPGFKGTDKFEGFYAKNEDAMEGGFKGERFAPSDEDKLLAETAVETSLKNSLKTQIIVLTMEKFKSFDEASEFTVLNKKIQPLENEPEKFGVFMEGEMRQIAIDEEMLKKNIEENARLSIPSDSDVILSSLDFSYSDISADLGKGEMSFTISGNAVFSAKIDTETLIRDLTGVDEAELRRLVFALPGVENANISLWPFWVTSVPEKKSRIEVIVE